MPDESKIILSSVDIMDRDLNKGFESFKIPEKFHSEIRRYVLDGGRPGSFVYGVFGDSLTHAINHLPGILLNDLVGLLGFVYNVCPVGCCGSREKVESWIELKGFRGVNKCPEKKKGESVN